MSRSAAAAAEDAEEGLNVLIGAEVAVPVEVAALAEAGRAAVATQAGEEGLDVRVSIAGDGPQRGALAERIRASRHAARFALAGYVDDMRAFYTDLDLFCLSSLREGMPNVVLEAMAMSLPVVATSAGGLSTFLRDGDDALLCLPGSPAALADALRAAIRSPDLRARLGQAARTRVEQECSFAQRMQRVFAVYDRLP